MKGQCLVVVAVVAAFATSGCSTAKQILGVQSPGDPSVTIKAAETRWLLIKNPRFGEVASEPEYVWVEEDKMPITLTTLVRGQGAIIATPEIVAKYGAPPGGGKISPRQGVPTQTTPSATGSTAADAEAPPRRAAAAVSPPTNGRAQEVPTVRLTEVREKFSVGDVQTVAPGARIQIKDRVVPK